MGVSRSFYRTVGSKIREERNSRNLSQEYLAAQTGLSRASIANIESGRQRFFLHTFIEIAETLDIELHKLLPQPEPLLETEKQLLQKLPSDERKFVKAFLEDKK